MLNVVNDKLVIEEKGIYSIENFFHQEDLCIGKYIFTKQ